MYFSSSSFASATPLESVHDERELRHSSYIRELNPDAGRADSSSESGEVAPTTERSIRAAEVRARIPYLEKYQPEETGVIHRLKRCQFTVFGPGLAKLGQRKSEREAQAAVRQRKNPRGGNS